MKGLKTLQKLYILTGLIYNVFAQDHYAQKVENDVSFGFSVKYFDTYKELTNLITNEKYALVCCNNPVNLTGYHAVVNTPLTSVGIDSELDSLPFFELLGISNVVKSAKPAINVTSPCFPGIADTPNATETVSTIFATNSNGASGSNVQQISVSATSTSLTPLQQSAWIIYVAHFFEMEKLGQQVYNLIQSKYDCHKSNLAKSGSKNIAWTTYDAVGNTWTIHNNTYTNTLVKDAGMKLVAGADQPISNLTVFQQSLATADFVIDDTPAANFKPEFAYEDWLNKTGFSPGSPFNFIADKNVYRTDNLINKNGFSDWPVRHSARADLALTDIIHMVYNTYEPTYTMTWLRGFALMRKPVFISNASYPDCSNAVARININTCAIGAFVPNGTAVTTPHKDELNASAGMSTGSKVGIAIGVIAGVAAIAVIGTFIYRKQAHQKKNPEGTFVKMNDM